MSEQQQESVKLESVFGFPEQWKPFHERHHEFFSRYPHLVELIRKTQDIQTTKAGTESVLIYVLGCICVEEFHEIMTMAANGYGIAALKLLRSMYERAVTMIYLCHHPEDADAFMDYYHIAQHKLLVAIENTFGPDIINKESRAEGEAEYARAKKRFMVTECETCNTERVHHTWHKLDVVSMAKKTPLGKLIVPAYYIPMGHAHTTVRSVLSRMQELEHGIAFVPDSQPREADWAFYFAHAILLEAIRSHINFFELDESLEELYSRCVVDLKVISEKNQPKFIK